MTLQVNKTLLCMDFRNFMKNNKNINTSEVGWANRVSKSVSDLFIQVCLSSSCWLVNNIFLICTLIHKILKLCNWLRAHSQNQSISSNKYLIVQAIEKSLLIFSKTRKTKFPPFRKVSARLKKCHYQSNRTIKISK